MSVSSVMSKLGLAKFEVVCTHRITSESDCALVEPITIFEILWFWSAKLKQHCIADVSVSFTQSSKRESSLFQRSKKDGREELVASKIPWRKIDRA
jgi:hypothetical protein